MIAITYVHIHFNPRKFAQLPSNDPAKCQEQPHRKKEKNTQIVCSEKLFTLMASLVPIIKKQQNCWKQKHYEGSNLSLHSEHVVKPEA